VKQSSSSTLLSIFERFKKQGDKVKAEKMGAIFAKKLEDELTTISMHT
jgi:hypothetical protein